MKKILGLDLGTNSIGWAVVNADDNGNPQSIVGMGSRIIPMDADAMGKFDKGVSFSQTKVRTDYRGTRRLRERVLLRRERLHRVLDLMGFLPEHYSAKLTRYGKFSDDSEPKLAWRKNDSGIYEFLFKESFEEMVSEFKKEHPSIEKVPYDWTIYYLRKKALSQALTKEELSWILLNFNQKRGYYQLRGEDEEVDKSKKIEYYALKVVKVEETAEKKNDGSIWYKVHLENGMIYSRASKIPLDWEGKTKEFIVTTDLNEDGSCKIDKEGNVKPSFRAPKEDDWGLLKVKTESDINDSGKTVGCCIYDSLVKNPQQKIIGKLVRTIERKYYREELRQILEKQKEFIPELKDVDLYKRCLCELYPVNEAHRNNVLNRDFTYLFIDDILFYQRPLKSKKSLISDCPYEIRKDKEGNDYSVKCIAKSNPYFQEFRLWQFVKNLKIYQREKVVDGKLCTDVDVTNDFIKSEDDIVALFEELNNKIEIEQDILLKFLIREKVKCDCLSDAIKGRIWEILRNVKVKDRASVFARFAEENFSDSQNLIDINSFGKAFKSISIKKDVDYSDDEITSLISKAFEKIEFKTELYRWNYVEDKKYPCNETRTAILKGLSKAGVKQEFLTKEKELEIWHILYSVEDKIEIGKAFVKYAKDNSLEESFAEEFAKLKPFEKEYGSYSAKASKKLLPLMRMGKYWSADAIDEKTKERIDKIITGEYDEKIKDRVREKTINLTDISQFRGLPLWVACYVVYNRHSEAKDIVKWKKYEDIDAYLRSFKQHSMRNPIVEQVVTETLRTVRDIWKQVGQIDEIHVELGREMKNPTDKRKRMTEKILENENTNLRIKAILAELKNPDYEVENIRPYSPSQQEILRIYEEYALNSNEKYDKETDSFIEDTEIPDYVTKVISGLGSSDSKKQPSKSDIESYKCWLEQRYRSPYTGKMIPLSKLFTEAYEIEHIIPQSRYFDDSFSNKVICEAEVNKEKSNMLGYEFIQKREGEIITLTGGKKVKIFTVEEYEDFVKKHFTGAKKKKLLMSEIPDGFIERQLNDTRYISKFIKGLLSNIVREEIGDGVYEQEAVSKNLISCTGGVTDRLKKDWGMDDVWNRIVLPRFERLNELTGTDNFTAVNKQGHLIPNMPLELQKGFNKKRIDHRHHAMDAIVIACATRSHVNYLNNESAKSENRREDLKKTLCVKTKTDDKGNYKWVMRKPWETFASDVQISNENMIVSFKKNLRVINKTVNKFEHYDENGKKTIVKQCKGDNWAIRKSLHKDTVFGEVNLRKIKEIRLNVALENPQTIVDKDVKRMVYSLKREGKKDKDIVKYFEDNKEVWTEVATGKVKVYYFTKDTKDRFFATRKPLDSSFTEKKIKEEVTDTGIQKILLAHLEAKGKDAEVAFSPDGIDELNKNITKLNGGKIHQPIYKVRVYEKADKFAIGSVGNKSKKFVEADKGTNLFFAIFSSEKLNKESGEMESVRSYLTIPLNVMIDCQKKFGSKWQANIETYLKECKLVSDEVKLLFILSPNDLVYLPTKEEIKNGVDEIDKKRIYKIVSFTGVRLYAVSFVMAKTIVDKVEYSQLNKVEFTDEKESIKEICQPICIDRLGNIISLGYQ
jgi:CRISPR-associated endonuclease Csn1